MEAVLAGMDDYFASGSAEGGRRPAQHPPAGSPCDRVAAAVLLPVCPARQPLSWPATWPSTALRHGLCLRALPSPQTSRCACS